MTMTPSSDPHSLYERIGGAPAIEKLIPDFYRRVLDDSELAPFFGKTDMEKLKVMQREFLTMALGGPTSYSGRPLAHVHHGRGITAAHFARFAEHLLQTLEANGISPQEAEAVIGRIDTYVNEITGASY
jgi:hemoglobin